MPCPTLEQLAEYQEQNLAPRRMTRIARHLEECAECRQALAALERTACVLAAVPAPAPARDLWPGVAARLEHSRRQHLWWRRAAAMVGVAASLFVGMLVYQRQQPVSVPAADAAASSYLANHQFLSARDPLTDRASVGAALASYRMEDGE